MFLSNGAMMMAAGQVRVIESMMSASISELSASYNWSGADSDRFERDWNELVRARLLAAANKLDGLTFTELVDGM